MTDYTELVKALRCCGNEGCNKCPYQKHIHEKFCWVIAMKDAAAAIEDLQKGLTTLQKCYEIADTTVDEVLKQLPKRGKWERELDVHDEPFYQCSVCGECFDSNRDSTHEVFKYCPDCGAKMEVQE